MSPCPCGYYCNNKGKAWVVDKFWEAINTTPTAND